MPRQMRSEMPSGFSEETAASREKRCFYSKIRRRIKTPCVFAVTDGKKKRHFASAERRKRKVLPKKFNACPDKKRRAGRRQKFFKKIKFFT